MKSIRFAMTCIFVSFTCSLSLANNTYYLPGDAFFYARLDLESSRALAESESPILSYGNHWNGGYGCGYIGYQKIEFRQMADGTKKAIVEAYQHFEDEIKKDPNLNGKMSVFVYSRKYDWKKYGLGLQYNEEWVDESVAFGASREHVRLESFVKRPESLMRNWRDSTLVDPLPAQIAKLSTAETETGTSVRIDSSKCRMLIIPNRDFDSYVIPANGVELIEICAGKLSRYERKNGEWRIVSAD